MSLTRTGSIATAVLMTIVVAGCGGSEPAAAPGTTPTAAPTTPTLTPTVPAAESITALSADSLVKKTKAAAKAAASVRVRGTIADDEGKPMKLDLSLATKGGSGTITTGGASIKVLVVGKTAYMQLSDAFWRQQSKSKQEADLIIGVVGGKWIKLALTNKDFGEMAAFASKPTFFDGLFDETGSVRKSGTKTIEGVPCIGLSDDEGTLWVDAASARPIRLEVPGKTTTESLTFSQYNQIKEPKAPPSSKVIDGKKLGM
jgi:hypothetical protein